ncbi:zinc ribbon domain-containing protein [Halovenus sp. WSH3]|uniref:Zinc ribbon domain-containing protein n=2 Tax=Halovenus carboxidivorans TaxID=2692199 RepID=A0A6B0SZN6_9EURY|nr:zinc ribbon domain-containing protein [Halovenus carboxidivorans]MXR51154.1 zinc ribbon domain-containing protein [Halovenus carboxidivorans]
MFVPGLGHLYLRLWGRAALWAGLTALGLVLAVPGENWPDSLSTEALLAPFQSLPFESIVLLSGVLALCIVDVYLMALRRNELLERSERVAAGESPQQCPNCGKELDQDIDFCHWCTTEIRADGDE